jgi:transcriptional regulator with XRE-family HTH domain
MKLDIVGKRIKQLRKDRGMTQRQLAQATGLPQSLLSQIEGGKRPGSGIRLDAARKIAFALRISLDALAGIPLDDTDSEIMPTALALVGS